MIIGIDARFFGPKAKGLGRYAQKLIEELQKTDDRNDYLIFLQRADFESWRPSNPRFKKVLANYRWYSLAEQLLFSLKIYRHKIDLMHFTHFNAPLFYRRPLVITIHDLILQRWPTHKNNFLGRAKYFFKNLGYKIVIRSALARAKKIITVSQFVKNDIIKSFGVLPAKVKVIYEGAPSIVNRQSSIVNRQVLKKYKIHKPYLLYVGNAYPHKNLSRLIEAFKILRQAGQPDLQFVLVGGEDYFYRQLMGKIEKKCHPEHLRFAQHKLREESSRLGGTRNDKKEIIFTGFVPDEELNSLYANAALYVFPSLYEGFGLPPLEAMSYGVPVVAARATCLPEVLSEAAHYFDAENPADMVAKISEVLINENLRQKLIALGFEQIKKYSWRQMAEETTKVYKFMD